MATIQVRENKGGESAFRAIIRRAGYATMTATFGTDEAARFWAAGIEARMDAKQDVSNGAAITLATTVRTMITRFINEVTPTKRGAEQERRALSLYLSRYATFDKTLADFGKADVNALMKARLDGSARYKPVCGATVRREFGALSGVFIHAIEVWDTPLLVNPFALVKRPQENPHRERRVTDDERAQVCASLGWKEGTKPTKRKHYVAWAFCFALETAMRRGEVLKADWANVNLAAKRLYLPALSTKTNRGRNVPLNGKARALLALLDAKAAGLIVPMNRSTFANTWNRAKTGKAWEALHFHDARHEATTRAAKHAPTVLHLQKVTGHKNLASLQRYFHPETADIADMLDGGELDAATIDVDTANRIIKQLLAKLTTA